MFLTVLLLGVAGVLFDGPKVVSAAGPRQFCALYGDPHLKPFLSSNMYFSRAPGWYVLLSNPYVTIQVLVSSSSSHIVDVCLSMQMPERLSVSVILF